MLWEKTSLFVRDCTPLAGDDRRTHLRAYRYWQARRNARVMPVISDCADMPAFSFFSQTAVIALGAKPGEAHITSIGGELDRYISPNEPTAREMFIDLLSKIPAVVERRTPLVYEANHPKLASLDAEFAFRGILLPLATDRGEPAYMMAVLTWKNG